MLIQPVSCCASFLLARNPLPGAAFRNEPPSPMAPSGTAPSHHSATWIGPKAVELSGSFSFEREKAAGAQGARPE